MVSCRPKSMIVGDFGLLLLARLLGFCFSCGCILLFAIQLFHQVFVRTKKTRIEPQNTVTYAEIQNTKQLCRRMPKQQVE